MLFLPFIALFVIGFTPIGLLHIKHQLENSLHTQYLIHFGELKRQLLAHERLLDEKIMGLVYHQPDVVEAPVLPTINSSDLGYEVLSKSGISETSGTSSVFPFLKDRFDTSPTVLSYILFFPIIYLLWRSANKRPPPDSTPLEVLLDSIQPSGQDFAASSPSPNLSDSEETFFDALPPLDDFPLPAPAAVNIGQEKDKTVEVEMETDGPIPAPEVNIQPLAHLYHPELKALMSLGASGYDLD